MASLEALLFDVDGTLADTERDGHRIAFNHAFADAGLDWDWTVELYGELLAVTGGKERIKHYLAEFNRDYPAPTDPDELHAFAAELHAAKTAHYTRMLAEGAIGLRPGVRRLIDEARDEGLRLAIATTTTPANVTALLKSTLGEDSESWFEVIAAGDIVPAKKPAPDIYLWAIEKMSLSPEQCFAFEDSENGIRSSLGANLKTLITTNAYTEDHDFSGAALVVDQFGEPDQPFRIIEGDAGGRMFADLSLVRHLHAKP